MKIRKERECVQAEVNNRIAYNYIVFVTSSAILCGTLGRGSSGRQ